MNIRLVILSFTLSIFIFGCHDEPVPYQEGVLYFMVKDTTSFKTTYNFFNSLNISITECGDWYYVIDTTPGNIEFYKDTLLSQIYFRGANTLKGISNQYPELCSNSDSVIELSAGFKGISGQEAEEWFALCDSLKIYEIPDVLSDTAKIKGKGGYIAVEAGKEDYWLEELQKYPVVRYVQKVAKVN